jgi:hypothetical protein
MPVAQPAAGILHWAGAAPKEKPDARPGFVPMSAKEAAISAFSLRAQP